MSAVGTPSDYLTRLPVFLNGVVMEELTSIELSYDSGRTEVFTLEKGFAGFGEGAKIVSARLNFAVPVSGLEGDVWNLVASGDWCTLQVGVGRQDFASSGKLTTCTVSNSVNTPVENSVEWRGKAGELS